MSLGVIAQTFPAVSLVCAQLHVDIITQNNHLFFLSCPLVLGPTIQQKLLLVPWIIPGATKDLWLKDRKRKLVTSTEDTSITAMAAGILRALTGTTDAPPQPNVAAVECCTGR